MTLEPPVTGAATPSRWRPFSGAGTLPTTSQGAEMAIVILVLGLRLGTLVQMAPTLPHGIEISPADGIYVVSAIAVILMSLFVSLVALIRRRPPEPWLVILDVSIAVALLVLGAASVPETHRLGAWEGFQPGYALGVLLSSSGVRGRMLWFGCVAAVIVAYLFFLGSADAGTAASNVFTFLILPSVTRFAATYLRRISADADRAREQAGELARREEERRAQATFHNSATVMRLLAEPELDPAVQQLLREQAQREAQVMRSYLRGDQSRPGLSDVATLAAVVGATCQEFSDLAIEHALDLDDDVELGRMLP